MILTWGLLLHVIYLLHWNILCNYKTNYKTFTICSWRRINVLLCSIFSSSSSFISDQRLKWIYFCHCLLSSFAIGIYKVKLGIDKAHHFTKFELRELVKGCSLMNNRSEISSEFKTNPNYSSNHWTKDRKRKQSNF